jgi:hypothetical protein
MTTVGYITVAEFRDQTNVQATEYSDACITNYILQCSDEIEHKTGRSWSGVKTSEDEFFDGNDKDTIWLSRCDLIGIIALSIDQSGQGTYTSVTPSYVKCYQAGYITLNRNLAEVTIFKAGPQTVKITYTWGFASPTDDIKALCMMMVRNNLHWDANRAREIKEEISLHKRKAAGLV